MSPTSVKVAQQSKLKKYVAELLLGTGLVVMSPDMLTGVHLKLVL